MIQKSFETSLAKMMKMTSSQLSAMKTRDKLQVQPRLLASVRRSYLLVLLRRSCTAPPAHRIGLFIQLMYPGVSESLRRCIDMVLLAADSTNSTVDVILTTTKPHISFTKFLATVRKSAPASLRFDVLSKADHRGSDNGVFLQQLLLTRELELEHDLILKLRTKNDSGWSEMVARDLCGSVETVSGIIDQFIGDQTLGMIGPTNLTFTKDGLLNNHTVGQQKIDFDVTSWKPMKGVWSMLSRERPRLPPWAWTLVSGSCYWVRANQSLWEEYLIPFAPKILEGCKPRQECSAVVGLEQLLPTLVTMRQRIAVP